MPYVLKIAGLVGGLTVPNYADPTGQYVKSYDPDAAGGRGEAEFTGNPEEAVSVFIEEGEE